MGGHVGHTPGPWALGQARMGSHNHAMMPVTTEAGRYLAEISPNARATRKAKNNRMVQLKVFSAEDEANARLIAAAPELLEALLVTEQWLTACLESESIAWDFDQREAATSARDTARAAIAKAKGEV